MSEQLRRLSGHLDLSAWRDGQGVLVGRLVAMGDHQQLIPMATARRFGSTFEQTGKLSVQVPTRSNTVGSFVTDGVTYAKIGNDGSVNVSVVGVNPYLQQLQRPVELLVDDADSPVLTHSLRGALAISTIQTMMASRALFSDALVFFLQGEDGRYLFASRDGDRWMLPREIDASRPEPLASGIRSLSVCRELERLVILGDVNDLAGMHAGVTRLLPHQTTTFAWGHLYATDPNLYDLTGTLPELALQGGVSLQTVAPAIHIARAPSCGPTLH